jgi:hypothetical protein
LTNYFFYDIIKKIGGVLMGKVLLSEYTAVRTAVNNLYTDLKKSYTWVNNPSVGSKATCAAVEELHTAITA